MLVEGGATQFFDILNFFVDINLSVEILCMEKVQKLLCLGSEGLNLYVVDIEEDIENDFLLFIKFINKDPLQQGYYQDETESPCHQEQLVSYEGIDGGLECL